MRSSSLVRSLVRFLYSVRRLLLFCSLADQIKSPVPFFAISQALSSLLRQVLSESVQQLAFWRERLSVALGKEGRILADVLPTLENIFEPGWLDSLPPVVPVGPTESEIRFQNIVRRVLMSFAQPGKPLVVAFGQSPQDFRFGWC